MGKAITVAATVALAIALGACGGSGGSGKSDGGKEPEKAEKVEEKAEESAQVFETDAATVEYQGTQDAAGNAVVTFSLDNRTGSTVMVSSENVVVNGEYAVQALGGSTVPIGPGETGAVSLSFGVQVQTPLSGTSDMETLSCDLVLLDNDSLTTELARVPVSVTL